MTRVYFQLVWWYGIVFGKILEFEKEGRIYKNRYLNVVAAKTYII